MATLKTAARNKMPSSSFGIPGERKYPMPDKAHAANAKARASQQVAAGNISQSTKARIDAKADSILKPAQSNAGKRTSDGKGHYSGH
jgi:hypothetical protein